MPTFKGRRKGVTYLNPFLIALRTEDDDVDDRSNGDLQEFKLRNQLGSQVNGDSEKLFSDTVN